ncbi:lipopolysaccharide heptosyltransferase family protein [Scandinavium goeteborgense]|uniref:glycosyltransferase family 9 protein n=1 Tax=Scandinavium goeteborgense TaxID=1851514 RepID=UPI0021650967|nr:glycosyltransferase family 9 protein [Scandinavium goeteborgense]MCS2154117.1 lipopolysaccharide heptosyltransferase family protein [Scandinavium goeteborgense]
MIGWLRKINRTKNYYLKKHKLKVKLRLSSTLSLRHLNKEKQKPSDFNHLIMTFIGKGIGDAIIIGGIIDTLVKNNYRVSVIADKRTHFLFEGWENISNLYLFELKNKHKIAESIRNDGACVFIDSHEITYSNVYTFDLIRLIKPAVTIGFSGSYSIYDHAINFSQPLGHVSSRYIDLFDFLGIKGVTSYDYFVKIPEQSQREAQDLINKSKGKKIVSFIPYGSVSERLFSKEQIDSILNYFSQHGDRLQVLIIGEQDKIKHIEDSENVLKNTYSSFFTAAELIKESALVISPDTSIVHLARAFQKKIICIYPYKLLSNGADNADTWGPNYNLAVQVRLTERRIRDANVESIIKHIDNEIRTL